MKSRLTTDLDDEIYTLDTLLANTLLVARDCDVAVETIQELLKYFTEVKAPHDPVTD